MKTVTPKKTTPSRTSARKAAANSSSTLSESTTPAESKRSVSGKAKSNNTTSSSIMTSDSKLVHTDSGNVVEETLATPEANTAPKKRTVVRKVVRRVVKKAGTGKVKTSTGANEVVGEDENMAREGSVKDKDGGSITGDGSETVGESAKGEETTVGVGEPVVGNVDPEKGKEIEDLDDPVIGLESGIKIVDGDSIEKEENVMAVDEPSNEVRKVSNNQELSNVEKGEALNEETDVEMNAEKRIEAAVSEEKNMGGEKQVEINEEKNIEAIVIEEKIKGEETEVKIMEQQKITAVVAEEEIKDELRGEGQLVQDEYGGDEGYEDYADRVDLEDHGEDDFVEEDPEEFIEETESFEEEHKELTAAVKERKNKKEYEIFVGGLDRDATEEDVRKVFETVGEVVEVRVHRNMSTNKSKGYAFVKFANKEHVKRALSEMKNPVIRGKRCGTAPSEDNDTLFLGNICNTWTKEAIKQKLKDYGVEGVENITLVADAQHEGRSRGFAFLEFSCHVDAMHAYKRLQKPDVVFGHLERTAKVAFAEPIREPDPEVMAHVKTVFLDGLPPHWDEDCVRERLHGLGEIVRIVLARNMSSAKRKDFGFIDFSSHEAAVACIERINNMELGDGNSKTRVKARLSNPMPKTQAVKGGMCGGFLIDRAGGGNSSRFGRNFGPYGPHTRGNFQRGRGFYHRGRGQSSRMDSYEYDYNNRYTGFRGRQFNVHGGRRGPFRGGYRQSGRGMGGNDPSRTNFNRPWHDAPERGHADHSSSRRQPFSPGEPFDRPYAQRNFDEPYFYDDGAHGMKRPFYMTDYEPDYGESRRHRARLDYSDPAAPFRGTQYRDSYGQGSDSNSHGYYGPDYGPCPPYYRGDGSYGGGYYY